MEQKKRNIYKLCIWPRRFVSQARLLGVGFRMQEDDKHLRSIKQQSKQGSPKPFLNSRNWRLTAF